MNPSYEHYGARGISVCKEWVNDFDQFVSDMGEVPEGMSLDRIDNEHGYSPENCRWATIKEQLNNQRRNHRIEFDDRVQTAAQWADELGLPFDTLLKRLQRMPVEQALQAGSLRQWRHGTRHGYEKYKCRCDECREANNARHRERRKQRANQIQGVEK